MATTSKQILNLQVHGLFSNPSTFTQIPQGALSVADNIVLDRENFVMPRRGMARYGTSFGAHGVKGMFTFGNTLLVYTDDQQMWYDSDGAGTWVAYTGTYALPSPAGAGARIRSVEANRNFYFLSNAGLQKLDKVTHQPRLAGAPAGLGGTGSPTGTSGFMPMNVNVAYRIVWGYNDANNNLILGAPSDRIIVGNGFISVTVISQAAGVVTVASTAGLVAGQLFTQGLTTQTIISVGSGTVTVADSSGYSAGIAQAGYNKDVQLTFQIPAEIDNTWFYQVYRSLPSTDITVQPNDELQQVFEDVPTPTEITNGYVTLTDSTTDNLLQQYLYTNPSQGGILNSNFRPPLARDTCFYKGYTFYSNTRTIQRYSATCISAEAPNGLQVGDTVSFTLTAGGNFTVTGDTVENAAIGHFKIFSTGNPGLDIQNTCQSLVAVINEYASNTFLDAYYTSSFGDLPGQMRFDMSQLSQTGFFMNSSRTTCWAQVISPTGGTAVSSSDAGPNRIYYSRYLQPEAVPLLNYIEVGSKNQGINRIIPLRDGIIILKQDGVFRLSGSTASQFVLTGLDNSVRIIAENSAAVLDNQVFFLSDQGVVAASDNAVSVMSRPIERDLLKLTAPSQYPNAADLIFAVTYNADRKYILSLPLTGVDSWCKQQYCLNTITNTWTRWTIENESGIVDIRDNKLYFGGNPDPVNGGYVFQERKSYTDQDFADASYNITITGVTGNQVSVTSTTNMVVGMLIQQISSASSATVTAVNTSTNVLTVDVPAQLAAGPAVAFTPIACQIKTVQIDAENPGIMKHFPEMSFVFSEANFSSMNVYFTSDLSGQESMQVLKPLTKGGWGNFNWGQQPWNGNVLGQQTRIRTLVPASFQRANWISVRMTLNQCFTSFGFSGMSVAINEMGSRQKGAGQ